MCYAGQATGAAGPSLVIYSDFNGDRTSKTARNRSREPLPSDAAPGRGGIIEGFNAGSTAVSSISNFQMLALLEGGIAIVILTFDPAFRR
jgi:hypothetical protein